MSTKIEWTDEVWNPVTGCTKVSQGCKNCYAERIAERFWGERKFSDVQCHDDRLEIPLHWRKPRRIFVNSMSDLFYPDVPDEFIADIFLTIEKTPRHIYQILTKRPEKMCDFISGFKNLWGEVLSNVWLGVSVEDQKTADERIPWLLKTPAMVRFVSYEPALGPVDFSNIKWAEIPINKDNYKMWGVPAPDKLWSCNDVLASLPADELNDAKTGLDWIIAGGESGPGARPAHPDWFRSVRDQCQAAGVPFFFKQWGEWYPVLEPELKHTYQVEWVQGQERCGYYCDEEHGHIDHNEWLMERVGKKRAGRLLDGREWNEYPL